MLIARFSHCSSMSSIVYTCLVIFLGARESFLMTRSRGKTRVIVDRCVVRYSSL